MNFFEQELHKFIDKTDYQWQYIGKSAYLRLGGIVIRVYFSTTGIADNYDALCFTAIAVNDSKLDSIIVKFKDFIRRSMRVIDFGTGFHWESAPTEAEYKSMTEQVEKYIDTFC